jgi:hypothetical protein
MSDARHLGYRIEYVGPLRVNFFKLVVGELPYSNRVWIYSDPSGEPPSPRGGGEGGLKPYTAPR